MEKRKVEWRKWRNTLENVEKLNFKSFPYSKIDQDIEFKAQL